MKNEKIIFTQEEKLENVRIRCVATIHTCVCTMPYRGSFISAGCHMTGEVICTGYHMTGEVICTGYHMTGEVICTGYHMTGEVISVFYHILVPLSG